MRDVPKITPEQIIESAKKCYASKGSSVTYQDYEFFKSQLHNAGAYGYESQLADALHL